MLVVNRFPPFQKLSARSCKCGPRGTCAESHELVRCLGPHWSSAEVEAAIWKLAGDAAAEGRLLVDLTEVELSHEASLALLAPGSCPIRAFATSFFTRRSWI